MSDGSNGGDRAMEALTDRSLWVDDRYATRCRGCESSFTLLRRRHHCRHCGQIFCNDCLANTSPSIAKNILTDKISALIGLRVGGSGKVCHECKYILLRRRKTERQSLQTCAAVKSLSNHRLSEMVISPVAVTTSGAAPLCEAGAMGKTGTEAQSGMESVEGFYASSGQRCEGYSVNMAVPEFSQSAASSLGSTALHYDEPPTTDTVPTHPEGAKERSITYGLADVPLHSCNTMSLWLNNLIKESRRQKRMGTSQSPKPVCRPRVLEVSPWASFLVAREAEARNFAMANVFSPSAPREELLLLSKLVSHHLMKRASLLFMSENKLASNTTMERKDWVARICDLAWRVVAQAAVFPREHLLAHLDVICVPGGSLADAEIINGVAFLQKVAFRGMKTTVRAPRILLLAGNVETAIKPLADLTEHIETCKGYLDKHYQRIKMWNPSVIVVEGRMHHYLLDKILEESHITLVLQAGKTVIHRLSRCCSAAVVRDLQYVSSVDLCDSTVLGTCELFQLLQVGGKSICAFSGLRAPLFTTVLLRGCGGEQLDAVRRVLFNCAATAYHLSLQVHCMMDLGFRCKAEPLDITTEDGILKPEYWENLSSTVSQDHSETLSMNIAIEFPKEREHADGKRNKFIVDSLEVNTAFVDTAAGDSAVGATQTSSACPSTRQSREMHNFYSGGDDTVCGYLVARALEGDSTRLIAHGNKRIWLAVKAAGASSKPNTQPTSTTPQPPEEADCGVHRPSLRGKATCKRCAQDLMSNGCPSTTLEPCSVHTLNLSWGAFLEFLIYVSPNVTMSCGHPPCVDTFLSFTLSPRSSMEVTLTLSVEGLPVYDIIPPSMTMPSHPDVFQLYYNKEFDDVQRCVAHTVATVQTALCPSTSQQLAAANQAKNAKQTLSQLLGNRSCTADGDTVSVSEEKGRALLKYAEDLIVKVSSSQSVESLTQLHLGEIADLVMEGQEWYNAHASLMERRGVKLTSLLDTLNLECSLWALEVSRNCCIRLDEPSSLMAITMQAMRIVAGGTHGSPSKHVAGGVLNQLGELYANGAEEIELTFTDGGTEDISAEKAIGTPLGTESPHQNADSSPSLATVRSVSEALGVLAKEATRNQATFKHVVNGFLPWDKSENIRAVVELLFPLHFAALQYLYCEGKVDELALSLSRCRAFKPQGGKTNSDFFVTLDGRFVLKKIRQAELLHFADFGPQYFRQMHKIYSRLTKGGSSGAPPPFACLLGKVLGLFSISVKGKKRFTDSSSEVRYFVLMENVFYSRQADVTYDLKGSQRNRTAPEGAAVLLDQDFAKTLRNGSFFFCTSEAKNFFMNGITRDAHLLATSSIMDYSLIVGVNHEAHQLYVGIIDYLHPYTGAKAIESKVKAGLETVLGGQGRDPTIIDPPSYRARFTRWLGECVFGVPTKLLDVR